MRYENNEPRRLRNWTIFGSFLTFVILFPLSIFLINTNPSDIIAYLLFGIAFFALLFIIPIVITYRSTSIKFVEIFDNYFVIFINNAKKWKIKYDEIEKIIQKSEGFFEIHINQDIKIGIKNGIIDSGDIDDVIMNLIIEKNEKKITS